MKKILLFFFALSCSIVTLFAQSPTLTSANSAPKPGDSYRSQSVAVSGVAVQSGGANKTWTYSNLVDSGSAIIFQAVLPSTTPFADSFPGSNVAVKTAGDSVYIYFTSTTNALLQNGVATSDSTILRSVPARTYLPYPFTYGSQFIGPVNERIPGYDFSFTGTDSISGDGYGTLIVGGKTYNDVLRVRDAEHLTFTLDTLLSNSTTDIYTVSYAYYTPNTHAPLFTDATTTTHITTFINGIPIPIIDQTNTSRDVSYLVQFTLPVTFQSFKANLQNKEIALQWNTAQEINADHFTVQRSLTGHDFKDIVSVNATGGGKGSVYDYTDKSFAGSNVPATVYYRIEETDKDGKQSLSAVAVVHGNDAVVIRVSPNPASNYIRISGSDATTVDAIAMYDTKGSLVKQWKNVSISQPLDISAMAKGTYLVKVSVNASTSTTTIVKQ